MMRKIVLLLCMASAIVGSSCTKGVEEGVPVPATKAVTNDGEAASCDGLERIELACGAVVHRLTDSTYLFQGDMLLTEKQVQMMSQPQTRGAYRINPAYYWPKRTVYYKFNENFWEQDRVAAEAAIKHWRDNTCLKFVKVTPTMNVPNYIEFMYGNKNGSYLGMVGGAQPITVMKMYENTGTLIHEIGHAVGMYHEQCRYERNNFVKVLWDNIKPEEKSQYTRYADMGLDGYEVQSFDFNSNMLYGSMYNSANGQPTMTKKDGTLFSAQRGRLSGGDMASVQAMYGPPFPRLETKLLQIHQDYNDYYTEKWDYEYSNEIVFYTDETYTVRQKLPYGRRLQIHYVSSAGHNEYYVVTAPSREDNYSLGTTRNRGWYDYGVCKESFYDEYGLVN